MSAAVTEIETHRFYARGRRTVLIRQPQVDVETAVGRKMRVQDPVRYNFAPDGQLTVRAGQDVLADGPPDPETGEPTSQDAVAWLTRGALLPDGTHGPHPQLNVLFWYEGHEPDRPLPTEDDFFAELGDAQVALEVAPIEVLLAQERGTHNRPVLVKAAERALATVVEARARYEAQAQAAEAEEQPQEGAGPPA